MTSGTVNELAAIFTDFGPKLLAALVCGGIVGFERELKNKAAGIKTNMMICAGSALYTALSVTIAASAFPSDAVRTVSDPARIAAQIVTGIGFLGGGAIIQSRGTIRGLTTAATIWVVAAIGICVGLGQLLLGLAVSLTVVGVLVGMTFVERKLMERSQSFIARILVAEPAEQVRGPVLEALEKNDLEVRSFEMVDWHGRREIEIRYRGHEEDSRRFLLGLWGVAGILEVRLT